MAAARGGGAHVEEVARAVHGADRDEDPQRRAWFLLLRQQPGELELARALLPAAAAALVEHDRDGDEDVDRARPLVEVLRVRVGVVVEIDGAQHRVRDGEDDEQREQNCLLARRHCVVLLAVRQLVEVALDGHPPSALLS